MEKIQKMIGIVGLTLILFAALSYGKSGGDSMENSGPFFKYDELYKKYGRQFGVPWRWIKAVAIVESNQGQAKSVAYGILNPKDIEKSKSSDGKSWGIMQTTLPTAQWMEGNSITVEDLNNPETSIRIGAKYLKTLVDRFKLTDRESVVRGYNGGAGFMSTNQGRTLTPIYYEKFKVALNEVMSKNQGKELEI